MGLEQSTEEGFNVADMVSVLKGHVKDGYEVIDSMILRSLFIDVLCFILPKVINNY
jgi:hypothetical protein